LWSAGAVGVAGFALILVALALAPGVAFASYLTAYAYWVGIAVGALILISVMHASSARWIVVLRRLLEAMAATLPLFALLFVPIALGLPHVFSWASPNADIGPGSQELLHEKATAWLTPRLFLLRAALYFVLWIGIAEMLCYWSRRQDESDDIAFTVRERRLGAAALPLAGLAMTFAAFDWLMSLAPAWGSTMFGLYWFSGSFLGTHALLAVAATSAERRGWLRDRIRPAHYHSMGKLMFAFVCFWAYIAFCQFMLMWIANEPDEIVWYLDRTRNGFLPIALALVFGKFAVPFFVLLFRDVKVEPRTLSAVALWLLAAQYLDMYWVVTPAFSAHGAAPRWTDLAAFAGIGGLAVAFGKWRLEGHKVLPARDPYLRESLNYSKP
jgi:hypothetical protein